MDDLIRRDDAIRAIEEEDIIVKGMRYSKVIFADYNRKMREGVIDILGSVPSANAKLVETGSWITVGKTKHGSIIRKCSACGVEKAGRVKSKYCPDCGAEINSAQQVTGQTSLYDMKFI